MSILSYHLHQLLPVASQITFYILEFGSSLSSEVFILYSAMAASLGQVYKGRLKENGDLVAVKVQRPFVLETVTVDLYVIRKLGLVLRKFPQVVLSRSDL